MPRPTLDRRSPVLLLALVCLLGPTAARLPAQLIPKVLTSTPQDAVPTRPVGAWEGTSAGDDRGWPEPRVSDHAALPGRRRGANSRCSGTTKVPTGEGQQLTVAIKASYRGSFRDGQLRMRGERIDVRIVEPGEAIPSEPQQVEGALANGVITGRVGSDDEGWSSFSVKPAGRADSRGVAQASPGFTGRWRGPSSRAPTARNSSTRLVQFSGTNDELRAEVAADLRYPTQGGGTTAVEYRATFRGSVEAGELRMRSEQVRIGLPEMNRTENGPPRS